jgi:hypothetical protein
MACQFNTVVHFFLRDNETRKIYKVTTRGRSLHEKVIKTTNGKYFFDWDLAQPNPKKGRNHSMISELYSASNESSIGINYDEDTKTIILWTDEENSTIYCRKGEITKAIDNIFQGRHNRDISNQKCRDQSFFTFRNSKVSNFTLEIPKRQIQTH